MPSNSTRTAARAAQAARKKPRAAARMEGTERMAERAAF